MRYLILLCILLGACDKSVETSSSYLLSRGYKPVFCTQNGHDQASCKAGSHLFRCVVSNASGCDNSKIVACEIDNTLVESN